MNCTFILKHRPFILQIRDSRCKILTLTKLKCLYPTNTAIKRRKKKKANRSHIVIYLDGFSYTFVYGVLYVDDPLFAAFNDNTTYNFDPSVEESIKLVVGLDLMITAIKY